jgi:hypothetical protein
VNTIELVQYELPTWVDNVSWNWLQKIVAKHYAVKVVRKLARYEHRQARATWVEHFNQQEKCTCSRCTAYYKLVIKGYGNRIQTD